jgi:trimeric autotransporter adhesin
MKPKPAAPPKPPKAPKPPKGGGGSPPVRLPKCTDIFGGETLPSLVSDPSDGLPQVGMCTSPIIFDLGRPGLDLTGLDDAPVRFDLDADGRKELTGWTAAGAEDAFLTFDRNDNGSIDDGMELFGNAVTLRDGQTSMQGYEALGEMDLFREGGNGNGVADSGDRDFLRLRLWTDRNHDGVAESAELVPLLEKGIFAISLEFTVSRKMDEHGNILAFSAPAFSRRAGQLRTIPTTDVFFPVKQVP